ncbi:MAG: hypothetical protein IKA09_12840 [Lachnospiraceae bacterium]|nr:hypothetical protein [Lachnospiraceae bacterium]
MRSKILLMIVLLCTLSMLWGCANSNGVCVAINDATSNSSESSEDEKMKHEIITITDFSDDYIVATNNKEEKYVIFGYQKEKMSFNIGQKIGVSYTEKVQNENGMYEISAVKITKERTIIVLPREK